MQRAIFGALALAAASCADPEPEPTCLDEALDLNGDGQADSADCDAYADAKIVATACRLDPYLWLRGAACGTGDAFRLPNVVFDHAVHSEAETVSAVDADRPFFVVSSRSAFFTLEGPWTNGRDRVPAWRSSTFGAGLGLIQDTDAGRSKMGPAVVAVGHSIWFDRNRDWAIQGTEVLNISSLLESRRKVFVSTTDSGPLVVVGGNGTPRAWRDNDGDFVIDDSEVLNLPDTIDVVGMDAELVQVVDWSRRIRDWDSHSWSTDPATMSGPFADADCVRVLTRFPLVCETPFAEFDIWDTDTKTTWHSPYPGVRWVTGAVALGWGAATELTEAEPDPYVTTVRIWLDTDRDLGIRDQEELEIRSAGYLERVAVTTHGSTMRSMVALERLPPGGTEMTYNLVARQRRPADRFLGESCTDEDLCADGLACLRIGAKGQSYCAIRPTR